MRNLQIQDGIDEQDVYIPIPIIDEKPLKEGSIELYESVLNECVQVDTVVKDYILKEHNDFKLLFKTRNEIQNFAESLQMEMKRWKESPECKEKFQSSIFNRSRRNQAIWMIASALTIALGGYVAAHDDLPVVGKPPQWLAGTLLTPGMISGCMSLYGIGKFCNKETAENNMLACIKKRLFSNLQREHLYSIYSSSKNSIRDHKEFKGFVNSAAGKIQDLGAIVTNYLSV